MECYTEDWACFARCFLFPAIGCLTTGYIQAVVVADQCNVFFYVFFGAKYTTPGKNKSILPFYNFILLTELGAYRLKHMAENKYL